MSVKELKCPKCGATVFPDRNVCDYCKAQYVVVREPKAILLEQYAECNTFKILQPLQKMLLSKWESNKTITEEDMAQLEEADRLLKACRVCHIKNCPFFNQEDLDLPTSLFFKAYKDTEEEKERFRKLSSKKSL